MNAARIGVIVVGITAAVAARRAQPLAFESITSCRIRPAQRAACSG